MGVFPFILMILQFLLIFMAVWTLIMASFRDPGFCVLTLTAPEDFKNGVTCVICHSWKPPRAHHCRRCNRCVYRMDHHCIWIGNCVGYNNQKDFILFLVYAGLLSSTSLLCVVYGMFQTGLLQSNTVLSQCLLMLLCVAGLKYSHEFLGEQIDFIESNSTLVETYQNTRGSANIDLFRSIFGDNCLWWLLPIHSSHPVDFSEPVMISDELLGKEKVLSKTDLDELGISLDKCINNTLPTDSHANRTKHD